MRLRHVGEERFFARCWGRVRIYRLYGSTLKSIFSEDGGIKAHTNSSMYSSLMEPGDYERVIPILIRYPTLSKSVFYP